MKNLWLTTILHFSVLLFLSAVAFAAPNIDGRMGSDWNSDWVTAENWVGSGGYVGPGTGGQDYDVEKIGVYVDDTYLYIGLQTGFELNYGEFLGSGADDKDKSYDYDNPTPDVLPGDIAIGFGSASLPNDYQLALKFDFGSTQPDSFQDENVFDIGYDDLNNADLKIFNVSAWNTVNYPTSPDIDRPFTKATGSDEGFVEQSLKGSVAYNRYDSSGNAYTVDNADPYFNTIEAKIKLTELSLALGSDLDMINGFTANAFWTMSCNNDELGASYTYEGSEIPEPATFLLFGMGLLGLGAFGRRKIDDN